MRGLTTTKTITLHLTADDWQLYTASCRGCANAALEINRAIEAAVNSGLTRREVEKDVEPVFKKYATLGACDSEPRWKLEAVLDDVFGKER